MKFKDIHMWTLSLYCVHTVWSGISIQCYPNLSHQYRYGFAGSLYNSNWLLKSKVQQVIQDHSEAVEPLDHSNNGSVCFFQGFSLSPILPMTQISVSKLYWLPFHDPCHSPLELRRTLAVSGVPSGSLMNKNTPSAEVACGPYQSAFSRSLPIIGDLPNTEFKW